MTTTVINGRPVAEYTPMGQAGYFKHPHRTDNIVGYVVRQTLLDGKNVNNDLAVIDGGNNYADAVIAVQPHRSYGCYATIDNFYDCGCRS